MHTLHQDLSYVALVCVAMALSSWAVPSLGRRLLRWRVCRFGEPPEQRVRWMPEVAARAAAALAPLLVIHCVLLGSLVLGGVWVHTVLFEAPRASKPFTCGYPYPRSGALRVDPNTAPSATFWDGMYCSSRYSVAFWVEVEAKRYLGYAGRSPDGGYRVLRVERQRIGAARAVELALLAPYRLLEGTCALGPGCGAVEWGWANDAASPLYVLFYGIQSMWLGNEPDSEVVRAFRVEERFEGFFLRTALLALWLWPGFVVLHGLDLLGLALFLRWHGCATPEDPEVAVLGRDAGGGFRMARLRTLMLAVTLLSILGGGAAVLAWEYSSSEAVAFYATGWLLPVTVAAVWQTVRALYGRGAALVFALLAALPVVKFAVLALVLVSMRRYLLRRRFALGWVSAAPVDGSAPAAAGAGEA